MRGQRPAYHFSDVAVRLGLAAILFAIATVVGAVAARVAIGDLSPLVGALVGVALPRHLPTLLTNFLEPPGRSDCGPQPP